MVRVARTAAALQETLAHPGSREALARLLAAPRYEVLPLEGVAGEVAAHLSPEAVVTVTSSPAQGPAKTVEIAAELSRQGFRAVPHLAARQYVGEDQLAEALGRLDEAGVQEVFVVGGDAEAVPGAYRDGEELLEAVSRLAPQLRLGVPGYPEGHPQISQDDLDAALGRKTERVGYVVAQLCLDPQAVSGWIERMRHDGIRLPVFAGVPGAVGTARLLRIARRIGVGDSLRFLSGTGGELLRGLAAPGRFDPGPLAAGLAASEGETAVAGLHLYTFNAVEETEQRRRRLLQQIQEAET